MLRGNGGQDIFKDNADRLRFCQLFQYANEKHQLNIHEFCLMPTFPGPFPCSELLERLKIITSPKALGKTCNDGNDGNILVTPRLWLRKELLKELMISENHQKFDK